MQRSGFFNALLNDGKYDRTYNANDYTDNLAVVISNGVLRSTADDLNVTAAGMVTTVGVGRAWIEGHYYVNDTPYKFAATTTPAGGARYDRIMLRLDKSLAVRSVSLVYVQGTASNNPEKPAPVREGNIYDIVLADIYVVAGATSVQVTDTRGDNSVCGWVYSTSGDNSFFASLDAAFLEWFGEKKDTLSSVSLFKRYNWRNVLESASNTVQFTIPQYDPETCFIEVFVNGMVETEGADYSVNGNIITFSGTLTAGTEVEVKAYKSIDGTGIMSVADEITELQNALLNINTAGNYFYRCNGVNDNVIISQMAQDFINASTEAGELTITVVGNFGATAPAAGDGTPGGEPYAWFNISKSNIQNRRVTLDFSGCSVVNIVTNDDKAHCLFTGRQYTVKNLCANFDGKNAYLYGQNVYFGSKNVYFENCRIKAVGLEGWLFNFGTFRDCEFSIKTSAYYVGVFRPINSTDVLRVYGGEHFAYTSDESATSAVFHCDANASSSVIITDGINCQTKAESGYKQTHAVYDLATSNYHRYTNIISELPIHAPSQTVRDTIALNK